MSCKFQSQDVIKSKNECYSEKFALLRSDSVYMSIMTQFNDTFKVMRNNKMDFGVPEIVSNKIDSAIFLSKKMTKCLLIVLQKDSLDFVFGTARIIKGILQHNKWTFSTNMEYSYSKSYYNLYTENSFENISKLARYSVLTTGVFQEKGCEFDEKYWFKD